MELISAGSIVQKLAVLEKKLKWVLCPFCDLECPRLRPCVYYQGGRPIVTNVCVNCAETPDGLQYMALVHKIPGVSVDVERLPAFSKLHEKYHSHTQLLATVSYGSQTFKVQCKGVGLAMRRSNQAEDLAKHYDNTFQVWYAIKNELEREPEEESRGWGK